MATSLFVAHALAALPVFVAAMVLWWKATEERLDDIVVDPRFLVPARVPEEAREGNSHR